MKKGTPLLQVTLIVACARQSVFLTVKRHRRNYFMLTRALTKRRMGNGFPCTLQMVLPYWLRIRRRIKVALLGSYIRTRELTKQLRVTIRWSQKVHGILFTQVWNTLLVSLKQRKREDALLPLALMVLTFTMILFGRPLFLKSRTLPRSILGTSTSRHLL